MYVTWNSFEAGGSPMEKKVRNGYNKEGIESTVFLFPFPIVVLNQQMVWLFKYPKTFANKIRAQWYCN